jgi:geranylgeranyl reductase family protein
MSREHFDVLVVGGGPSGSAAARTLAAAGRTVCLIDKATFPREKLCGGLITLRSKRIFEDIFESSWNDEIFNSSTDISFFSNGRFLANVEGYSRLFFTMRYDFDNYLLDLARAAGAHLKLAHTVSHFDLDRKLISLESGLEISFDHLVGADGVNSAVAKQLFGSSFNADTIGFGLEVEVPRSHLPAQSDHVEIDFSAAQWGYGWIFPKRNNFTIGVGGIHKFNPDLRLRLDQYLNHKGLAASEFKVKGQYIPFGDFRKRPGSGDVLLCGDAAGVVDPITGEGIAYAMQSGRAAARAILNANPGEAGSALHLYSKAYDEIASSIRQANFWRHLIFSGLARRPFAWAFVDAGTLQRGFLDILAGKHEYNALYGLFIIQIAKAVRKPGTKIRLKF